MKRRACLAATLLLAAGARGEATGPSLPRVDDLGELADEVRRRKAPLLILFSIEGCPYCLEVRRNYLQPRLTEAAKEVVIREVDIGSPRPMRMLDGSNTTESAFAARFDVRVAPVIVLLDARMMPLGEPLVGLGRSGFYEARLQATIEAARQRLRERP